MQVSCILSPAIAHMTPPPPLLKRPPLLLRAAGWRLAVAAGFSALLLALWYWAVA